MLDETRPERNDVVSLFGVPQNSMFYCDLLYKQKSFKKTIAAAEKYNGSQTWV